MPHALHVVRKFEPHAWGGIETHLVAMIPALHQCGWSSEVYAPREQGTSGAPLEQVGATFRSFQAYYPYLGLTKEKRESLVACGGNLLAPWAFAEWLMKSRVAILHSHTLGRLGATVRTVARLRRIPYAVTLHGPVRANAQSIEQDARRRTKGLIDLGKPLGWILGARRVIHDADLVYVFHPAEFNAWADVRRGRHLRLVAHGVSASTVTLAERQAARRQIDGLEDAPYVVVVARLDRAKGQERALRAMQSLPENAHLVLIGASMDSSYESELKQLATHLKNRVHFAGGLPPALTRALIAEARLLLLPSFAEPFGIVLLEAWAEGTPALFANVDGPRHIATQTGALWGLLPEDDVLWPERLRSAWFNDMERDEESQRVRKLANEFFSWRHLAEVQAKDYANVCNKGQYA